MENDTKIPAKRVKIDDANCSPQAKKLSVILQREIDAEIKLRTSDLETIEENLFLTKQSLLKLRRGLVSDYYKQKSQKDLLQYPPHPAIQDSFIGKRPRNRPGQLNCKPSISAQNEFIERREKRRRKRNVKEGDPESTKTYKPPRLIQPKPAAVDEIKPPEPRGFISKKQIRIVVGNVSKWLSPDVPTGATHKWTVYTKTTDHNLDLSTFVSKVLFFLHPSYKPNDVITVDGPPFKLTRRGWGEFPLKARFFFKNPLDTPVDVVHVLKLDEKHTGLETFGSETTLSVWLNLPSNSNLNEPASALCNNKEDILVDNSNNSTKIIQEDIEKLVFEETLNRFIKLGEKNNATSSSDSGYFQTNLVQCKSPYIGDSNLVRQVPLQIKEEPCEIIVNDVESFEEVEVASQLPELEYPLALKSQPYPESLDLFANQEGVELNQLSSSLVEAGINPEFHCDEITVKKDLPVVNNVAGSLQNVYEVNSGTSAVNIVIKSEPEEFRSYEAQESHVNQGSADDFLDECNIVESEVIIDCDDDDLTSKNCENEDTEFSDVKPASLQNNFFKAEKASPDDFIKTEVVNNELPLAELSNAHPEVSTTDINGLILENSYASNTTAVTVNSMQGLISGISQPVVLPSSAVNNTKNTLNLAQGRFIDITSSQTISHDLIHPSVKKEIYLSVPGNIQSHNLVIIPTADIPSFQAVSTTEELVKSGISTQSNQINSIEITDNGRTIASGVVPIVKVVDNSPNISFLKPVPRKVFVRKLNGEVATIVAPISPEILSKSLKVSTVPQTIVIDNTGTKLSESGSQTFTFSGANIKTVTSIKNQNIPCTNSVKNISLRQNVNTTQATSSAISNITFKSKRKNNPKKDVKSTVIMLQKENGEVILKKEAKFSDLREDIHSNSVKRFIKITPEVASHLGNKRGNGKEISGAVDSKSVVHFTKSESNLNPSLIKLQQPTSSKSIIIAKSVVQESLLKTKKAISCDLKVTELPKSNVIYKRILPTSSETDSVEQPVLGYNKSFKDKFKASILLECPTQSPDAAVSWLMRKLPLVDKRAEIAGFKSLHPYCAKTREEFLSWPYGKRRAAEMSRARHVWQFLKELDTLKDKLTILQVYDFGRLRAFTPLKIHPDYVAPSTSGSEEPAHFYNQPTEEILKYIKKCKDLKEEEIVDIDTVKDSYTNKKSGPLSYVSSENKEFKFKLPPTKEDSLFEPELAGLKKYISECVKKVGTVSSPEFVAPGVLYSAADRILISAFHSFVDDVLRRAHNASWIRHDDNPPVTIIEEDVKLAIRSRDDFDFLLPLTEEKKERPPVSVLPNIS